VKVNDLIAQLSKIDQNLEIHDYSEDESIATHEKPFRFFFIDNNSVNWAILSRGDDGMPQSTFDNGPVSQRLALISKIADF
jgi:hypothetical protein